MGLLDPAPPPYDPLAWAQAPLPERGRAVCQAWAVQGYGTPLAAYGFYAAKLALYVGGWIAWCACTPGLGRLATIDAWWLHPIAFTKAILWSMLFEGLGLGCGSGPLTGRYVPPIGGAGATRNNQEVVWADRVRVVPAGHALHPPRIDEAVHREVEKAIDRGRRLHFRYSRLPEKRADEITCDPLGLLFRPPVLYLIARNAKGALRQYALHRMERAELLSINGQIFIGQGAALNKVAADDVKILVTGNPANTNALIAMHNAPDIPKERFNALTRLDHNRAKSMLAKKLQVPVEEIKGLAIWGNHDDSMYPDLFHTTVGGKVAADLVDQAWIADTYIPTVATRGGAIIKARGLSSAASAANATIDHMRDWMLGTGGEVVSMSVPSDGSYGLTEGLISSFPCTVENGEYSIVQGLDLNDFSRERIEASVARLASERDQVKELGLIS